MAFPRLRADIAAAQTVTVGAYAFKVFSAGERCTSLAPELVREVVSGLIAATMFMNTADRVDSIVSIHVAGAMWALPVAMVLGLPLKLFTTEPNGATDQQSFEQKRLYLPRTIYAPDLASVGRCVIIDDVLSGGGTITQMKAAIEAAGGTVAGAICVVDKLGSAAALGEKLGVPVTCLASAT